MSTLSIEDIFNFGFHPDVVMNTVPAGFCDQPPSGGSRSLKPARPLKQEAGYCIYSLVPKESNVTLVPHITLIRPNTLSLKGAITLFWVNTKRKTVMTLIRIVLLSNGCAVITLFKIYLKRVMTDPFTFECHYSLLDHVKLKLQS